MGGACGRHRGAGHVRRGARAELPAVHLADAEARHVAGADRPVGRDDAAWPDPFGLVRAGGRPAGRSTHARRRLLADRGAVLPGNRLSAGLGGLVRHPLHHRHRHQPALYPWRSVGAVAGAALPPRQGNGRVQHRARRRLCGRASGTDRCRHIGQGSFPRRDCRLHALRGDPARRFVEPCRLRGRRPVSRWLFRFCPAGAGAAVCRAGFSGGPAEHLRADAGLRISLWLA